MKLKQGIGVLILLLIAGTSVWAIRSISSEEPVAEDIPTVITTLYPLYETAVSLAGDSIDVSLLLNPGVEPHAFEPSPSDIVAITNADVFIYTGDEMEPWVADLLAGIDSEVTVIDASQGIDLIEFSDESKHDHSDDHSHDSHDHGDDHDEDHSHDHDADEEKEKDLDESHDHDHSGKDPHFWLDFERAQIMTTTIRDALVPLVPESQASVTEAYETRIQELTNLDQSYTTKLATCSTRTFVHGGHYAFGYLANRYDLEYASAQGFSPNSEPTAQTIANLVNLITTENARAIFTEELVEPRIAEIISEETNVPVLKLHGAHNISAQDFENQVGFIDLMEQNLENLTLGLGCSS